MTFIEIDSLVVDSNNKQLNNLLVVSCSNWEIYLFVSKILLMLENSTEFAMV